jgi:hypothetical protein
MELRPELMPPALDEAKVLRLAAIASKLDGYNSFDVDELLRTFNREAGTELDLEDFQKIYSSEDHENWVRRVLVGQAVRRVADVTRSELTEVVRRAMPGNGYKDYEAYMAVFDANAPLPGASNLIFYPLDYDPATNTWGRGQPMGEYDPTPEQIVEWALASAGSEDRA